MQSNSAFYFHFVYSFGQSLFKIGIWHVLWGLYSWVGSTGCSSCHEENVESCNCIHRQLKTMGSNSQLYVTITFTVSTNSAHSEWIFENKIGLQYYTLILTGIATPQGQYTAHEQVWQLEFGIPISCVIASHFFLWLAEKPEACSDNELVQSEHNVFVSAVYTITVPSMSVKILLLQWEGSQHLKLALTNQFTVFLVLSVQASGSDELRATPTAALGVQLVQAWAKDYTEQRSTLPCTLLKWLLLFFLERRWEQDNRK